MRCDSSERGADFFGLLLLLLPVPMPRPRPVPFGGVNGRRDDDDDEAGDNGVVCCDVSSGDVGEDDRTDAF